MNSEEARIGARVMVRNGCKKPELWGVEGTIAKRWGAPHYALVEVRFEDGRSELFWRHEVEDAQEEQVKEGAFVRLRWG